MLLILFSVIFLKILLFHSIRTKERIIINITHTHTQKKAIKM
jgi:hypothetical protein